MAKNSERWQNKLIFSSYFLHWPDSVVMGVEKKCLKVRKSEVFFDIIRTLSPDITVHRAGSQLKMEKCVTWSQRTLHQEAQLPQKSVRHANCQDNRSLSVPFLLTHPISPSDRNVTKMFSNWVVMCRKRKSKGGGSEFVIPPLLFSIQVFCLLSLVVCCHSTWLIF